MPAACDIVRCQIATLRKSKRKVKLILITFYLTKIVSFQHVINIKNYCFLVLNLGNLVCFLHSKTHLDSGQPHSKCLIIINGWAATILGSTAEKLREWVTDLGPHPGFLTC